MNTEQWCGVNIMARFCRAATGHAVWFVLAFISLHLATCLDKFLYLRQSTRV